MPLLANCERALRTFPFTELSAFYLARGIAVDHFGCPHKVLCANAAAPTELHRGAEAYVGEKYGVPLRIVVVSLSINNGVRRLTDRASLQEWLTDAGKNLNPHMQGTLELLSAILKPEVSGRDVFRHFALTNSAKCSLNGTSDKPPEECFRKCAEFVIPELEILSPHVVITQGRAAKISLASSATPLPDEILGGIVRKSSGGSHDLVKNMLRELYREYFSLLRTQGFRALWLKLVHPSDRGGRYATMRRQHVVPLLGWAARTLASELAQAA